MLYYSHPVQVRYRGLFEDTHIGIAFHDILVRNNGEIILLNDYLKMMSLLGISEDDAIIELEWLDLDKHL